MKVSELIAELQKLKDQHGDISVSIPDGVHASYTDYTEAVFVQFLPANKQKKRPYGIAFSPVDHIYIS
jgi:hypothetical protein